MLKKIIGTIALSALVMGCEDKVNFKGKVSIDKSFAIKNVAGEVQQIPQGTFASKITVEKGIAKVRINVGSNDDSSVRFLMNIKNLENGKVIPASDLGQPADLLANYKETVTQSGTKQRYQTCNAGPIYQNVCNPGPNGQIVCHPVLIGYRQGNQYVTFYEIYRSADLAGTLFKPGTSSTLANIAASTGTSVEERIVNISACY